MFWEDDVDLYYCWVDIALRWNVCTVPAGAFIILYKGEM